MVMIKTFINEKKVSIIPPLLVNEKRVTNFAGKVNTVNVFFSKQCRRITNHITLPLFFPVEKSTTEPPLILDERRF